MVSLEESTHALSRPCLEACVYVISLSVWEVFILPKLHASLKASIYVI
jgi:hypothetical protein